MTDLSLGEEKQYSRHLLLSEVGEEGQLKLKAASVLVVGAGGLGCPILQYLAAAGVGNIGVIDHDVVDQTNLQRQLLYTHEDIGKLKVKCAIKRLSQLNPYIEFTGISEKLDRKNAIELFHEFDIIVDGSDNFQTRYLVNDAAVLTSRPIVFGSIFKFEGQVSVFNYEGGPTYRCIYPTPPAPGESANCSEIGVIGTLPGIIGSYQANEVIKMICGIGEVLSGKLLLVNTLDMNHQILKVQKNERIGIKHLEEDYDFFCGIRPAKKSIGIKEYQNNPEAYQLLDVRTLSERQHLHLGGIHIPLNALSDRYKEIPKEKPVLVYCQSGVRSESAIQFLEKKNPEQQFINLKGGMSLV